jgi:hypothetical protein
MTDTIDPKDGGYGQVGCLLDVISCLLGGAAAVVIEIVGASPGVRWNSIWVGAFAGLVVSFVVMDPLLIALARFKVPRKLGDSIFFIVALVLPGLVTAVTALILAGVLG